MFGTKFFYIRDKHNFPVVCVATRLSELETRVHYAWATWNPKDKFSKVRAREIAEGRLIKSLNNPSSPSVLPGDNVQDRIMMNMFFATPIEGRVQKTIIAELKRRNDRDEESERNNASDSTTTGVPVFAAVSERNVSVSDAANRTVGTSDYQPAQQVSS